MTVRSFVLAAVLLVLGSGCSSSSFSALSSRLEDDAPSGALDTLFVSIDLPRDVQSYANNLAVAFDSVFATRGVITQSSANANLALENIPNLSRARETDAPHLLLVRKLGTASGRAATHDATLYDTQSEARLWSMQIEMSGGRPDADFVARFIYDALKADGLLSSAE